MKKFWILFILFFLKLNSQTFNISGKVTNENNQPIENATITLLKQKDSSIISFTGSSKNGAFSLKIPQQKETSILQISADKFRSFSKKFESIDKNEDIGILKLQKDLTTEIEEVQITVSPVKIKKDTIEYNASYLKVKPDSKIDDLLKEIPGVETDEDGKITVNGKPINKILINGKPFLIKTGKLRCKLFRPILSKKSRSQRQKRKKNNLPAEPLRLTA